MSTRLAPKYQQTLNIAGMVEIYSGVLLTSPEPFFERVNKAIDSYFQTKAYIIDEKKRGPGLAAGVPRRVAVTPENVMLSCTYDAGFPSTIKLASHKTPTMKTATELTNLVISACREQVKEAARIPKRR